MHPDLAPVQARLARLQRLRSTVGQMPASPPTLRGRVSRGLVRLVHRMLFWFTPQVNQVQDASLDTVAEIVRTLEQILLEQSAHADQLRTGSTARSSAGSGCEPLDSKSEYRPPHSGSELSADFLFSLQDQFRGSPDETAEKLRSHLDRVLTARPAVINGRWLDIGCGRGEWIELAAARGAAIEGIDSNTLAVEYCMERGLPVAVRDALDDLRPRAPGSLHLVSLFHVVEHIDMPALIEVLSEIRRVLASDGLLLLETPNPRSLRTMTQTFWFDPTHHKPIPMKLIEFVLEYLGYSIEASAGVNELTVDTSIGLASDGAPTDQPKSFFNRRSAPIDSRPLPDALKGIERQFSGPQDYFVLASPTGD
jgi:SAM-dependent methyltransferase